MSTFSVAGQVLGITRFVENEPIDVGETTRAFAGGARSSVRAQKRTFTATTSPQSKTVYDALLAACAKDADVTVTGDVVFGVALTCKVRLTYDLVGIGTAVDGYTFLYVLTLTIKES